MSYKGFSLVRLVMKINREQSLSLSIGQHTHTSTYPLIFCSITLPVFCLNFISASLLFGHSFFLLFLKSKDACSYFHPSEMALSRLTGMQYINISFSSLHLPCPAAVWIPLLCRSKSSGPTQPSSATFQEVK